VDRRDDARHLARRAGALIYARALDAVAGTEHGVLWLHGPPGSGKSALCARLAVRLRGVAETQVVAYRFRAADPRSSREAFLTYAIDQLERWGALGANRSQSRATRARLSSG
jgi:hypothetical protein